MPVIGLVDHLGLNKVAICLSMISIILVGYYLCSNSRAYDSQRHDDTVHATLKPEPGLGLEYAEKLARVEARVEELLKLKDVFEKQLTDVETRFEKRFVPVEQKLADVETRLEKIFARVEQKLDDLEARFEKNFARVEQKLADHDRRLEDVIHLENDMTHLKKDVPPIKDDVSDMNIDLNILKNDFHHYYNSYSYTFYSFVILVICCCCTCFCCLGAIGNANDSSRRAIMQ